MRLYKDLLPRKVKGGLLDCKIKAAELRRAIHQGFDGGLCADCLNQ